MIGANWFPNFIESFRVAKVAVSKGQQQVPTQLLARTKLPFLILVINRFPYVSSIVPDFVALAGNAVTVRGVRFEEGCEVPFARLAHSSVYV